MGGVQVIIIYMETIIRQMVASRKDDPLAEVKIKYGLKIVKSETVKCVILLAIFILLDRFWLYISGLLSLLPLRAVSGGLHFRHEMSCLIFSLLTMVLGLIVFPKYVPCGAWIYGVLPVIIAMFAIISPVASPNKPIVSIRKWKHMKILSILISVIESIAITILLEIASDYGYPMFWILTMQGLQLIPGAIIYGFGKSVIKEGR